MLTSAIRRRLAGPSVLRTAAIRHSSSEASNIAGATAQSREFSKKEKAHEDYYVRQREAAQLAKLREQLSQHREELDKLQKEVEEREKAHSEQK